jgi:hypothetical protein
MAGHRHPQYATATGFDTLSNRQHRFGRIEAHHSTMNTNCCEGTSRTVSRSPTPEASSILGAHTSINAGTRNLS